MFETWEELEKSIENCKMKRMRKWGYHSLSTGVSFTRNIDAET